MADRPRLALASTTTYRSARPVSVRAREWSARLPEHVSVLVSIVLTAVAQSHLFAAETLVSLDSATQYYPWYGYLGQALRAGHIPGWNAATFSGTPFVANPLSGWMYVPAMVLFALLPLDGAVRAYVVLQPMLAAGGAYALASLLGVGRAGAVVAAVAYANTSFLQVQNVRSDPFASVYAWLPIACVGVELAVRHSHWQRCVPGWALAAVAMSQIIAVWPGQGAYYAAMLVGGYIACRTLLVQSPSASHLSARLTRLVTHNLAVFLLAATLGAAGILPRLEFNGLSNLAGGYTGEEASVGGLHPRDWLLVAVPGYWYAGATVLALAIAALFLKAKCLRNIGYFGVTSLGAVLVSGRVETPLHWLLYHLLPGFASLHPHAPERIMTVAYLGPALLAGAGLAALEQRGWVVRGIRPGQRARALAPLVVVLLVAADLAVGGTKGRSDVLLTDPLNGADKLAAVDLTTYYQPDATARFLQVQRQADGSPGRFIGYAPYSKDGTTWPYTTSFMDPATAALEVDNRALAVGLQDAQGYDAIHIARYDAYLAVMNGRTQNYHDAEVFWAGLQSPLLDLLNVRYIVVPPANRLDLLDNLALRRFPTTVYTDAQVRVLENPSVLPRAWLVHSAAETTQAEALAALNSGRVQARSTVLLEEPPPVMTPPLDATSDRAEVTVDDPDRMAITTSTTAPGMLVLSEVYYPAWQAYLDNLPAHVYVADGALRAVQVPAGIHQVELRFESVPLMLGCVISGLAVLFLTTILLVTRFADRRRVARANRAELCDATRTRFPLQVGDYRR